MGETLAYVANFRGNWETFFCCLYFSECLEKSIMELLTR